MGTWRIETSDKGSVAHPKSGMSQRHAERTWEKHYIKSIHVARDRILAVSARDDIPHADWSIHQYQTVNLAEHASWAVLHARLCIGNMLTTCQGKIRANDLFTVGNNFLWPKGDSMSLFPTAFQKFGRSSRRQGDFFALVAH